MIKRRRLKWVELRDYIEEGIKAAGGAIEEVEVGYIDVSMPYSSVKVVGEGRNPELELVFENGELNVFN